MLFYRIAKERYARDLSGYGAAIAGGRWNSQDVRMLYLSEHPATAAMEVLVHVEGELPDDLVLLAIDLPDDPELYSEVRPDMLTEGWDANPSSPAAAAIGDAFIREQKYFGLYVPSVIMPEARNILLNPSHPAMQAIRIAFERPYQYDPRLRP